MRGRAELAGDLGVADAAETDGLKRHQSAGLRGGGGHGGNETDAGAGRDQGEDAGELIAFEDGVGLQTGLAAGGQGIVTETVALAQQKHALLADFLKIHALEAGQAVSRGHGQQDSFSPVNIVPGMGYSPDKMLQARLVSYDNAHRYRLGVNFDALPVNRPQCPVDTYHRDGTTRFDDNGGIGPNYEPNSFGGPVEQNQYTERPMPITGDAARYNHREGNDDYRQPGDLYRQMTPDQRTRLIHNLACSMQGVPERIVKLQIGHFTKADAEWGRRVAEALGVAEPAVVK